MGCPVAAIIEAAPQDHCELPAATDPREDTGVRKDLGETVTTDQQTVQHFDTAQPVGNHVEEGQKFDIQFQEKNM